MADFRRLVSPPSSLTGSLAQYLQAVAQAINAIPALSAFSDTVGPNSNLSGYPGDLAVNLTSATTGLRLWQLGGSVRKPSNTGWNPV